MSFFRSPPDGKPPMPDHAPAFYPKRRLDSADREKLQAPVDSLDETATPTSSEPSPASITLSAAAAEALASALFSAADVTDATRAWRSAVDAAHAVLSRGLEFSQETANNFERVDVAMSEVQRTRSAFGADKATLLRNFGLVVEGVALARGLPCGIPAPIARDLAKALRHVANAIEALARWRDDAALARAAIHPSLRGARLAESLLEEARRLRAEVSPGDLALIASFGLRVDGLDPRGKGGDNARA